MPGGRWGGYIRDLSLHSGPRTQENVGLALKLGRNCKLTACESRESEGRNEKELTSAVDISNSLLYGVEYLHGCIYTSMYVQSRVSMCVIWCSGARQTELPICLSPVYPYWRIERE